MTDGCCTVRRLVARRFRMLAGLAMIASIAIASGCAPAPPSPSPSATPIPSPSPSPTPDPIAGLTLEQRVGQLFMVGTPAGAADEVAIAAIRDRHVGNVFLAGRSRAGVTATAAIVAQFEALVGPSSTAGAPLLVATDQEGGQVQVLQGPGFSTMPSALDQGAMTTSALRATASAWGRELAAAGLNMNLAPVVDLVPSSAAAPTNAPIGRFNREFGYNAETITTHAKAFREGFQVGGVVSVLKHFPGLGFVTQNTDTASGVTDNVTTADSASVGIFHTEIEDGARCVMVSSAIYTQIDPSAPAVFSSTVIQSVLRGQLGFRGVVMSDDLSAAAAVGAWTPADRAVLSIEAGVDLVLASAVPAAVPEMVDAVVARARIDSAFAARVDASARRVLALKGG